MDETIEYFHPGEFIQEELDARKWSHSDCASAAGIEETELNKIIEGKTEINHEISRALAKAFNVDDDFFYNLKEICDRDRRRFQYG